MLVLYNFTVVLVLYKFTVVLVLYNLTVVLVLYNFTVVHVLYYFTVALIAETIHARKIKSTKLGIYSSVLSQSYLMVISINLQR